MHCGSPARRHRTFVAAVIATLLSMMVVLSPHADRVALAATEGLAVSSATTYVVDADAGIVRVSATLTLTNTTVDTNSNGSVRRLYYTGFSYPAPLGTANESAVTASGAPVPLDVNTSGDGDRYVVFKLSFPAPLFSGDALRITVTYDVVGLPPRSDDPARVNPAYFAFVAYGPGDPGKASIRVEIPSGLVVDTFGGDAVTTVEGGTTIITADAIGDPPNYTLFVTARNDSRLEPTSLTADSGASFTISGWPGDTEWRAFVQEQITTGLPQLTKLIGRPWPITEPVLIREAVTPYLYGYAGWFSAASNELEIGENLDADTVLHELSHAWFNTTWFDDRWVNEGLAQVYSNATLAALGQPGAAPTQPIADSPAAVTLLDWGDPKLDSGADDTETYGYNASYWLIQQLVDEIGVDGMADVFRTVDESTTAYVGDGPAEKVTGGTDWRRFLDVAQQIGGSTNIEPLMADFVLRLGDKELLPTRTVARSHYADLVAAGNGWSAPRVIRDDMAAWNFDDASTGIDTAQEILGVRTTLTERGTALGLDLTSRLEAPYESATDLDTVLDSANATAEVADLVIRADNGARAEPSLLERLGLVGADIDRDVDAARAALEADDEAAATTFATRALDTRVNAETAGTRRLVVAIGASALFALIVIGLTTIIKRRRSDDDSDSDRPGPGDPAYWSWDPPTLETAVRPPTPDPSR